MALTDRIVKLNGIELTPVEHGGERYGDYRWEQSVFPIFAFNIKGGSKPDILSIVTIEDGVIVSRSFSRPRGEIKAGEAGEWVSLLEVEVPALEEGASG